MTGLRELDILDDARHNPAVGIDYGTTWLGRLLLVGMSHYGDELDVRWPGFTHMIIGDVIDGRRKIAYFTKIAGLFNDYQGVPCSPKELYSSVAFYNFLPDVFMKREPVQELQWGNPDAHRFFFRVLDALKPQRVLITGEKLWQAFPSKDLGDSGRTRDTGDETGPDVLFRCPEPKCCWYRVNDADPCLIGAITHPSTVKFNKTRDQIAKWLQRFMTCKEGSPERGTV